MFDRFLTPYQQELSDPVHSFSARLMYHYCGNVASLHSSVIRSGVDILNYLQPTEENMSPELMYKNFFRQRQLRK